MELKSDGVDFCYGRVDLLGPGQSGRALRFAVVDMEEDVKSSDMAGKLSGKMLVLHCFPQSVAGVVLTGEL